MKKNKTNKQAYDKILKENLEKAIPPLLSRYLGMQIIQNDYLEVALHSTIKREVDYLRKVKTQNGEEFILHLEFQISNEKDMLYRIAEYHGMIQRKYPRLEIRHFVIYLGNNNPTMLRKLEEKQHFRGFELINIKNIEYQEFLSSTVPEEIVLAILANFDENQAPIIIRFIIYRLKEVCKSEAELRKYVEQLNLLSQARKLDDLTNKTINNMPFLIDITENAMYKEAVRKGLEKGMQQGLEKGMQQGLEKGMKQGLKEGLQKGLEQGIEQGRNMVKAYEEEIELQQKQTIERMLERGMDENEIVEILAIDIETVIAIKEDFSK